MRTSIFLIFLLVGTVWAKPTAMVTDLSGKTQTGKQALHLLETLELGHKFKVPKGSSVTLSMLSNGARLSITGPIEAQVGKDGIRVLVGDEVLVKKLGGRKGATSTSISPVSLTMGAEFHRSKLRGLLPVGKVLEQKPTYSWFPNDNAEMYRISVYDGTEKIFSQETEMTALSHPSGSSLREGRRYTVRVSALVEDDEENFQVVQSVSAPLQYVNNEELLQNSEAALSQWSIDKTDRSLVLASAAQCLNAGLYSRALTLLKAIDSPEDGNLANLRSRVYTKVETLLHE